MLGAGGLANIVRAEGFKGLYQGLGPSLMALLPNWAVGASVVQHGQTGSAAPATCWVLPGLPEWQAAVHVNLQQVLQLGTLQHPSPVSAMRASRSPRSGSQQWVTAQLGNGLVPAQPLHKRSAGMSRSSEACVTAPSWAVPTA
jgi:hypothetical protein